MVTPIENINVDRYWTFPIKFIRIKDALLARSEHLLYAMLLSLNAFV